MNGIFNEAMDVVMSNNSAMLTYFTFRFDGKTNVLTMKTFVLPFVFAFLKSFLLCYPSSSSKLLFSIFQCSLRASNAVCSIVKRVKISKSVSDTKVSGPKH